jgi:hypothetical protein
MTRHRSPRARPEVSTLEGRLLLSGLAAISSHPAAIVHIDAFKTRGFIGGHYTENSTSIVLENFTGGIQSTGALTGVGNGSILINGGETAGGSIMLKNARNNKKRGTITLTPQSGVELPTTSGQNFKLNFTVTAATGAFKSGLHKTLKGFVVFASSSPTTGYFQANFG